MKDTTNQTNRPLPKPPQSNRIYPKTYAGPGSIIQVQPHKSLNAHEAYYGGQAGGSSKGEVDNYSNVMKGSTFFVSKGSINGRKIQPRSPLPPLPPTQRPSPTFPPGARNPNSSGLPLGNSSILIHSGFWNILEATGSRFFNTNIPAVGERSPESNEPKRVVTNSNHGEDSGKIPIKKKRISVDQISRPVGFTHILHASDADQAEDILRRWQKDGIGKLPTPSWIQPIKDASRARARAVAVAEVQANRDDIGSLKIVNGLPSIISTVTTSTLSSTGATEESHSVELGIVKEEDHHEDEEELKPPHFPGLGLRTNTSQTMVVKPEEDMGTMRMPRGVIIDGLPLDDSSFPSFDDPETLETTSEEDEDFGSPKNFIPSLTTIEKAVAAKIFFETHYHRLLKKTPDRETRKSLLEGELARLNISDAERRNIRAAFVLSETNYLRDMRSRVGIESFTKLKVIGHGAFGVVSLAREKKGGDLFAIKQIRKAEMLRKGQEGHIRAERDLLASAATSTRWTVRLAYSFQDQDHLYLCMAFMSGGDLLTLLIEKDIFPEDFARFYLAEMVLAIEETHVVLGAIHRDIKPDNFLFDSNGHIKIADFGLATDFHFSHDGAYYEYQREALLKKYGLDLEVRAPVTTRFDEESKRNEEGAGSILTYRDRNRRKLAYSVVGTNNYMAVEVIRGRGYDASADWWSLGVIAFEMLYGYPPFVSKSRQVTRQKIASWRTSLRFPSKPYVSREAQDFIANLICSKEDRLGYRASASSSRPNSVIQQRRRSGLMNPSTGTFGTPQSGGDGIRDGAGEIKSHPFFKGIDFNSIHLQTPPFVPQLSSPEDVRYFENDIEDAPIPPAEPQGNLNATRDPMLSDKLQGAHLLEVRKQLAFTGWTYKKPKGVYDLQRGIITAGNSDRGRGSSTVYPRPSLIRSLSV